ncbi:DUF4156 domain-containing protein [Oceanospirillum linum]|uniref:DUF4156 domain-containing protein n=1 Tax=Oceanospirillum linum TaxID=966 RepID=A0A1T1H846_OCELI|nr:DUF4156 domain-containing protein [Oceanospirillum linum]OOV85946.1 hypothetical protein BTA35_0215660 [Oceanospirillum linum]SEG45389.1 protein of unknown function [Oleiphilus messinensis]SMP34527.1 protein of unknown function [Oceanospirillum linum]
MKKHTRCKMGLLTLGLSFLSACSWVKAVEGSDQVLLAKAHNVVGCEKLGHTNSFVKDSVAGLSRNQDTIMEELVTLGKNQAVEMGADTIVQTGPLKDGKVGFDIYKCKS